MVTSADIACHTWHPRKTAQTAMCTPKYNADTTHATTDTHGSQIVKNLSIDRSISSRLTSPPFPDAARKTHPETHSRLTPG